MRFLIVIALCLAVASASYNNRNQFNRMIRALQRQQQHRQQQQLLGNMNEEYYQDQDQDQDDDDEQDYYQQQQQCSRNSQECDSDDQECDQNGNCDQDDEDQQQQQNQQQGNQNRQSRQQQQQQRRQQQKHQCQPKYQLLQDLEQANAQLAAKLYKQAKQENDDKNTAVSPTAVQLALAALSRGARGQTKRQINQLIGAGLNQQQQQQAHAALQKCLKGQGQCQQQNGPQQAQVKTTTTIVVNQQNQAQQKFIQAAKACANAQVKKCNFQRQPQQCRQQINQHVAQKTNQKLQHTVPQDAITQNTKMVIVNTAQLKANWGQQFRNQQTTKQGRFHPLGQQQAKQVQMLQSQGQFNYYEDAQVQVVGIPTQRQELTMYVIVPKTKNGLTQIEKQQVQNPQQLKQLLDQADQQQQQVDVELPKFQIKHKIDAKQTLQQQGCQDAFDAAEADLSGINGQQQQQQNRRRNQQNQNDEDDDQQDQDEQQNGQQQNGQQLHCNKLIHQTTIKVNEQGISAANKRQNQNQQQNQYQQNQNQNQQDQDDEDDEDQDDDEQNQYQQQSNSQGLCESIFGQRQCQQQRRRQQQQRNQRRNQGQGQQQVKANRAFAFAIKHNQSNQIVMVGRVVDATQKPKQNQQGQQQSLNGVDQQ